MKWYEFNDLTYEQLMDKSFKELETIKQSKITALEYERQKRYNLIAAILFYQAEINKEKEQGE